MITTRNVCPEDGPFLLRLFVESRRDEFTSLGWPEEQLEPFLRLQYQLQQRSYLTQYPRAKHQIIVWKDRPVGQMLTACLQDEWRLIDISVLPENRGQGIGTSVLRELQNQAFQAEKPLRLNVIHHNTARRLYERLGFRLVADLNPYVAMEWSGG